MKEKMNSTKECWVIATHLISLFASRKLPLAMSNSCKLLPIFYKCCLHLKKWGKVMQSLRAFWHSYHIENYQKVTYLSNEEKMEVLLVFYKISLFSHSILLMFHFVLGLVPMDKAWFSTQTFCLAEE